MRASVDKKLLYLTVAAMLLCCAAVLNFSSPATLRRELPITTSSGFDDYFANCGWHCKPWKWQHLGDGGIRRKASDEDVFKKLFGCVSNPCFIGYNPGGDRMMFALAGKAATLHPDLRFVIDGPCKSACVIFADIARERVCITKQASFWFHQGYSRGKWKGDIYYTDFSEDAPRFVPGHSPDVDQWVRTTGAGYPTIGFTIMPIWDAEKIWPYCEGPFHPQWITDAQYGIMSAKAK